MLKSSELVPLLFLICLNEFNKAIVHSIIHHFADGTNMVYANRSQKTRSLTDLPTLTRFARVSLSHLRLFLRPHANQRRSHASCCTSCPFTPKGMKQSTIILIVFRKRLFPCCLPLICLDSSLDCSFL